MFFLSLTHFLTSTLFPFSYVFSFYFFSFILCLTSFLSPCFCFLFSSLSSYFCAFLYFFLPFIFSFPPFSRSAFPSFLFCTYFSFLFSVFPFLWFFFICLFFLSFSCFFRLFLYLWFPSFFLSLFSISLSLFLMSLFLSLSHSPFNFLFPYFFAFILPGSSSPCSQKSAIGRHSLPVPTESVQVRSNECPPAVKPSGTTARELLVVEDISPLFESQNLFHNVVSVDDTQAMCPFEYSLLL